MLELGFSLFHITLSLVRIEHDRIWTKSVAFSPIAMTILVT